MSFTRAEWERRKNRKTPAQEARIRRLLGMGPPTPGPKQMLPRRED